MKRSAACFAAIGLLILATPALAGLGISSIDVFKERQLTSVPIKAIVHGDDDSNAVLRIFQGTASYDTGMVMIRRPHGPTVGFPGGTAAQSGEIFEGRILNMTPGVTVEYYIEGIDPNGNLNKFSSDIPDTTSCAIIRQLVATGPVYYADQTFGDDNNPGTKARPTRSINAALAALAASPNAGANGGVFVGLGEYHEQLTLGASLFPTDGAFRFIEGISNRDSTILCGANELLEQGLYAPGKPIRWKACGQDSTYMTYLPGGSAGPADSMMLVVLGWGEYIERKTSIRAILNDSTKAQGSFSSTNGGELSGWFWQNDTLYLKRRNGRSPAGQKLHCGYLDALIAIQRRNWRIANLTIRFAGSFNGDAAYLADPKPATFGSGVQLGTNVADRSGSGIVVDSCTFYGFNAPAIMSIHWSGGTITDTVTIAHSTFSGPGMGYMDYGAGKARLEEHAGQVSLQSRVMSFVGNTMFDLHNGIETGLAAGDSTSGSQSEIVGNVFHHIVDDSIEPDDSHAINSLISDNLISNGGSSGISMTPIFTGPMFVLYNTIQDTRFTGIKMGGGSTGKVLIAQNTIISQVSGAKAFDGSSGGSVDGVSAMNNVLFSRNGVPVVGPNPSSTITNSFNFDWFGGVNTTSLFNWNGLNEPTKPQVQAGFNWERNGLDSFFNGDIAVVDSTRRNLSLGSFSPGLNTGRRITGINTGLNGNRYQTLPDIGSEERIVP